MTIYGFGFYTMGKEGINDEDSGRHDQGDDKYRQGGERPGGD